MNGDCLRQTVHFTNPQGLHVRPSAAFAEMARRYQSTVTIYVEDRSANGKSPLDLMMLAAMPGSELTVEVAGPDAPAALEALVALLGRLAVETAPEATPTPPPETRAQPAQPNESS